MSALSKAISALRALKPEERKEALGIVNEFEAGPKKKPGPKPKEGAAPKKKKKAPAAGSADVVE